MKVKFKLLPKDRKLLKNPKIRAYLKNCEHIITKELDKIDEFDLMAMLFQRRLNAK